MFNHFYHPEGGAEVVKNWNQCPAAQIPAVSRYHLRWINRNSDSSKKKISKDSQKKISSVTFGAVKRN